MIFLGKTDDLFFYISIDTNFFWMMSAFCKIAQYADSIFAVFSALVSAGDNCMIS
jgi:hypothetical protein